MNDIWKRKRNRLNDRFKAGETGTNPEKNRENPQIAESLPEKPRDPTLNHVKRFLSYLVQNFISRWSFFFFSYKHRDVVDPLEQKVSCLHGNKSYARFFVSHAIFQEIGLSEKLPFPATLTRKKTQREGSLRRLWRRENPFIHGGLKVDCT